MKTLFFCKTLHWNHWNCFFMNSCWNARLDARLWNWLGEYVLDDEELRPAKERLWMGLMLSNQRRKCILLASNVYVDMIWYTYNYIYIYMYLCIYVIMYLCIYCICTCTCVCVCVRIWICVCVCLCICMCMSRYMYCIRIRICVHICVYIHANIYI
jgi:hypothetical protein